MAHISLLIARLMAVVLLSLGRDAGLRACFCYNYRCLGFDNTRYCRRMKTARYTLFEILILRS